MKILFGLLALGLGSVPSAEALTADTLVDFESGSEGAVVTSSLLSAGTKGNVGNGWKTLSNPGGGVEGATPNLTITSNASYPINANVSINGTSYSMAGTRGLRATLGADNAVQLSFPSPGYQLSVGFFFRFNGPQINNSPRDVVGLRSDPTGNYQFLQIYDGPQPFFHTHWQPGGSGIGNNVNFSRNKWYWVTMRHVAGGGTMQISFYDPANNYALVGTSNGSVTSGTQGCTTIQIGCIKYSAGGTQSVDFDNFVISTNGTFPLLPDSGTPPPPSGVFDLPADRRIDWTGNVGIPGGIPNRTTIYTTVPAGASLATVQTAVNNCPVGQVVQLSAGSYTWPSGSSLNMKSGITLRGAGPSSTIINTSAGTAQHGEVGGITFASEVYTGSSGIIPLSSGYTKGSTTLVASSADANLKVGYTIVVNQTNDGSMVYNGPAMPGGYLRTDITPEGDGLRCLNQRVLVTAINGNNITISPPLYYTLSSSLNPHIFYYRSNSTTRNNIEWAGVEDLSVVNSNSEGTCIGMNRAAYCWVKNVTTKNAAVYHIGVYRAYRCEIRHNTCDTSLNYTSSHGYVIVLEYQSGACLIEDNIVVNQRQFIETNSGSSGNVVAYNYMANAMPTPGYGFMVHSGGNHSAHPMMNLFEGNIGYKWNGDYYWGSASHQTLLRNWFGRYSAYANQVGSAIVIDEKNSYNNIIGNVLGYSGINSNSNWTTRHGTRVSPQNMAYDRVWSSIRFGYWSDSDAGGGFNANTQWANTIVAGNYDYVTNSQSWINPATAQTIPNSYYYPSKPAYFGSLNWPPIDPSNPTVGETAIPAGYRYANGVDPVPGTPTDIPHPADTNSDFLMSLNEATSFGACWKSNCNAIATLDNAVRAGTLWNASPDGAYHYTSGACPACWVTGQ